MSQIAVDTRKCRKDLACVAVCPSGTLAASPEKLPTAVAESSCIFCGHCVAICPTGAITHAGLPQGAMLPALRNFPKPELVDGFLLGRRSVREFKERPLSQKTIEQLLEIARHAPTASNSQKLHWIVVNGAEKVRALSGHVVDCLRAASLNPAAIARWDAGYDFALRAAPTLVLACAPADYEWARQDCAIALTFMELAAESRGLGACWAGYLTRVAAVYPPLQKALAVPEGYMVAGGLMLGERRFAYRRIPTRKPLSVQWN